MAPRRPKHNDGELISPKVNYYGSLADYKESMTASSVVNNTTFQSSQEDYYDRSGEPGGSRFVKLRPIFPEPQSIKNMPVQLAGYTDYARKDENLSSKSQMSQNYEGRRINVQGKPAVGVQISNPSATQDFLNTRSVFVNPEYKDPYDKIGNDPDSKDRSRSPLIVSKTRQDTLRAMGLGVNEWAEATSKYFDKPFVVGKSPNYSQGTPLTTIVNISGAEAGERYAGRVDFGGSQTPGLKKAKNVLKAPGGENRITKAKAHQKDMALNTDLDPYNYGYASRQWAQVVQHEFGHTMGIGHPHSDPKGTTLNSEMSYDAPGNGATILPATINAYKKQMDMNLGYTGVEKLKKKYKTQQDAAYKLQKLNERYEKNQRFKSVYDN